MKRGRISVFILFQLLIARSSYSQTWTMTDPAIIGYTGSRDITPSRFTTYRLDYKDIHDILWLAPNKSNAEVAQPNTLLTVGMANGTIDILRIVRNEMMEPGLATAYPDIRTFRGISDTNPNRTIRIATTGPRPFEISGQANVELNGMVITAGTSMISGAFINLGELMLKDFSIEKNPNLSVATLVSNTGGESYPAGKL